jgi:hypothetical protein
MPMKYCDSMRTTVEICLRTTVTGVHIAAELKQNRCLRARRVVYCNYDIHDCTAKQTQYGSRWQQLEKSRVQSEATI